MACPLWLAPYGLPLVAYPLWFAPVVYPLWLALCGLLPCLSMPCICQGVERRRFLYTFSVGAVGASVEALEG